MLNPFIGNVPQTTGTGSTASLHSSPRNEHGNGTSFSAVLERNAHASEPTRSAAKDPARPKEETAANRPPRPASERSREKASVPDRATEPPKQEGTPAAVDENDTSVDADPAETGIPASLAAIASIIAALRGPAATVDMDDVGDDALLDGRSKGFTLPFSDLGGKSPRSERLMTLAADETGDEGALTGADKPTKAGTGSAVFAAALATQPNRFTPLHAQAALPGQAEPVSGLALTGAATAALRPETTTLPQLTVPTPAGQRAWAEDVGSRLMWMVGKNESKAELVLTPPNLGKLGVSIQVNGDQTTAHFVAANQAAREALEQAMPRLREILQQAGINLGQTNVSTSGEQQARDEAAAGTRRIQGGFGETQRSEAGHMASASGWALPGSGVIDTFA